MSDFATMQATMLEEAHKPNASTPVKRSIVRALKHYRAYRTWFTQKTGTVSLTQGTAEYSLPSGLISIDDVRWTNAGQTRFEPLEPITVAEMRDLRWSSSGQGTPTYWALHHERIILYPTPNVTGDLLSVWYQYDATANAADGVAITEASAGTVTNAWFTTGEPALRTYALYDLFLTWVHDPEKAGYYKALNAEAEADLMKSTAKWNKPGRIRSIW